MARRDETLLSEIERDLLGGKPLADLLRKCVVLGGRSSSVELRDWASRELRGYNVGDDLPSYRTVGALFSPMLLQEGQSSRASVFRCRHFLISFKRISAKSSRFDKASVSWRRWSRIRTRTKEFISLFLWPPRSLD